MEAVTTGLWWCWGRKIMTFKQEMVYFVARRVEVSFGTLRGWWLLQA